MAKTNNLTDFLTDLADGIREVEGTTDKIDPQDFRDRVEGLVATVTSTGDATAGQILSGKKAWVDGAEVTGTMANQGAKTATLNTSTTSYTIPAGYHNGSGKVSITTETKSATPSTSSQTVTPTSGKVLSSVTVAAIPNQKSATDVTVSGKTVSIPAGYYSSAVSKSVGTAIQATPAITITADDTNDKFTIEASATQTAGYVSAGTTSATKETITLTASGATVTASDGTNSISKAVTSGSATTPTTTITANPSLSTTLTSGKGYKMSVSKTQSVTPTVKAGYVSAGTAGNITVSGEAYVSESSTGAATSSTTATATRTIGYGQQATIGAGYYPSDRIVRNSVPAVSGSIGGTATSGSATAAINNVNNMNTITDTSNKTAGTDYFTVKATASGTAGGYTPKYTVNTAGYIGSTVTGSKQTVSVSSDSTGKSIHIPKASLSASGTASATTTVAPGTVSIANKSASVSGKTQITASPTTSTSDISTYYMAVNATAAANSTGTTSSISGTANAGVSSAGYAPASLTGSGSVSGTATAKTSAKTSSTYYLPIASGGCTVSGGGLTAGAGSAAATGTGIALGTATTTKPTSGNYITVTGSGQVSRADIKDTHTAGYIPAKSATTVISGTTASSNTATVYYPISSNIVDTSAGTATAAQILKNQVAYVDGAKLTGTMTNNGAASQSLNAGGSYTIPAGYHNGSGKVTANSLSSQTSGTAAANEILAGETAWVNGSKVTGTMPTVNLATPGITITADDTNDKFTIDASVAQLESGYVSATTTNATKKTITLTTSGATATMSDGTNSVSKNVASGSATTPATTISSAPSITIDDNGLITASNSKTQSVTPTVSAGYVSSGTAGTITVGGSNTKQLTKRTSSNLTASGATVTAPAGYYPAAATKTIASGSATTPATTISSTPSISIDSSGLITASNSKTQSVTPTVSAGYISSGTAGTITVGGSATKQLTTKAATTYTPTTSNQTIAAGTYCTGAQTIEGDSNLVAGNIKSGVSIFGVDGTLTGVDTSDATATAAGIRSGQTAYVNGTKITGTMPTIKPSSQWVVNNGILYCQVQGSTKGTWTGTGVNGYWEGVATYTPTYSLTANGWAQLQSSTITIQSTNKTTTGGTNLSPQIAYYYNDIDESGNLTVQSGVASLATPNNTSSFTINPRVGGLLIICPYWVTTITTSSLSGLTEVDSGSPQELPLYAYKVTSTIASLNLTISN